MSYLAVAPAHLRLPAAFRLSLQLWMLFAVGAERCTFPRWVALDAVDEAPILTAYHLKMHRQAAQFGCGVQAVAGRADTIPRGLPNSAPFRRAARC